MNIERLLFSFSASPRRVALGLGFLKLLKAVLAVYSLILSAKFFGASLERDSWVIAATVVGVFTQFLFGPINEILRAKFIHIRAEQGEDEAIRCSSSLTGTIVTVILLVVLFCLVRPRLLSDLFAPGFTPPQKNTLDFMIRLVIPTLLLNEITTIWTSLLNAYRSFYIPDLLSVVSVFISVAVLLIFAPVIGIYSLVISLYINLLILSLVLLRSLNKLNRSLLRITTPDWSRLKGILIFSLPFYFPYLLGQMSVTAERVISTYIGVGSVSVIDYSRKFIEMPINIVFGVITTVLTPILAQHCADRQHEEFYGELSKFIRMTLLVIFPIFIIFTVCPGELVDFLLLRGSFTLDFARKTSLTLFYFGFGLLGVMLYVICGQAMVSKKSTLRYAQVSSSIHVGTVLLNILLFKTWGLATLAVSWSLCHILGGAFLFCCVYSGRILRTLRSWVPLFVSCIATILASVVLRRLTVLALNAAGIHYSLKPGIILLSTTAMSVALLTAGLFIFRAEEKQPLLSFLKGMIGQNPKVSSHD